MARAQVKITCFSIRPTQQTKVDTLRSLGQKHCSSQSHWWEQDFRKFPRRFPYFPERPIDRTRCFWNVGSMISLTFLKNKHISICRCSPNLAKISVLYTFALMLDIMDLKRQLAKSLKFNGNMCVSYIPYASHWSLPWATLSHFYNEFQWFAWFNMSSPLCIVIENLFISIGKWRVSARSLKCVRH